MYESRGAWNQGETFTMVGHDYLELVASNPDTPTDVRLSFLVMARVNSIGHAEFRPGELARALGTVDSSGVIREMSPKGVRLAIARLVSAGVFKDGNARCIQVSTYGIRREGNGSGNSCYFCGINTDKRRTRRKNPDQIVEKSRVKEISKEAESTRAKAVTTPDVPAKDESLSTAFLDASKGASYDPWDMPAPVEPKRRVVVTPEPEEDEPHGYSSMPRLSDRYKGPIEDDRRDYETNGSLFDVVA